MLSVQWSHLETQLDEGSIPPWKSMISMAGDGAVPWPIKLQSAGYIHTSTHTSLAKANHVTVPSLRKIRGGWSHHVPGKRIGTRNLGTALVSSSDISCRNTVSLLESQTAIVCFFLKSQYPNYKYYLGFSDATPGYIYPDKFSNISTRMNTKALFVLGRNWSL